MIVKVAGRAMMSLLCSVHLLCSDEQVFCAAVLLLRAREAGVQLHQYSPTLLEPDSHLCQRVMLFLIHSLSLEENLFCSLFDFVL